MKFPLSPLKKCIVPFSGALLLILVLSLFWYAQRGPLVIETSNPQITISGVHCTVGTNHAYFFGNTLERLLYPLEKWRGFRDAHHARFVSAKTNTVIWMRLEDKSITPPPPGMAPRTPPTLFKAQMTGSNGQTSHLSLVASGLHYQRQFHLVGWELNGRLEDHAGAKIDIRYANGTEAVTLRIK